MARRTSPTRKPHAPQKADLLNPALIEAQDLARFCYARSLMALSPRNGRRDLVQQFSELLQELALYLHQTPCERCGKPLIHHELITENADYIERLIARGLARGEVLLDELRRRRDEAQAEPDIPAPANDWKQ